jgi:hypothetical protein
MMHGQTNIKNTPDVWKPKRALPYSQKLVTDSYYESQSTAKQKFITKIYSNIILTSKTILPNRLLHTGLSTKNINDSNLPRVLYVFPDSFMLQTNPN